MATSKKDYVAAAAAISNGQLINCPTQAEVHMNTQTRSKIAHELADHFERSNPRFDRVRFLEACGVQS